MEEQIDAVLIFLDAKKAFDSVDHVYIEKTFFLLYKQTRLIEV